MRKSYLAITLLATVLLASLTVLAQTQSREDQLKAIEDKRKEITELEKKLLAPSDEDSLRYEDFLRAPDTGLMRLLPREKYDSEAYRQKTTAAPGSFPRKQAGSLRNTSIGEELTPNPGRAPSVGVTAPVQNEGVFNNLDDLPRLDGDTPRAAKRTVTIRGGGAYYSFTMRTNEYGGSHIELDHGQLQTGFAGANYGFLTSLGDTPLESVDLQTPIVQPLATYVPPAQLQEARLEQSRFGQGAKIEGVKVKSGVPMKLNSTYLLRAVNYAQSDVLVAFRVVRIDSDGSAVILWKLLEKYPTPQISRN